MSLWVSCWAVCYHSEGLRGKLAFSLCLIPVQTRSSFWYDKHLPAARSNLSSEPWWHTITSVHTKLIQSHSQTSSQSHSFSLLFLFIFLSLSNRLAQTLSWFSRNTKPQGFTSLLAEVMTGLWPRPRPLWNNRLSHDHTLTSVCSLEVCHESSHTVITFSLLQQTTDNVWFPFAFSLFFVTSLYPSSVWLKQPSWFHLIPMFGNNLSCLVVTEARPEFCSLPVAADLFAFVCWPVQSG